MDNKEFDDIIKKKLESLNTNGSEDAWDLFKEKWDNESSSGEVGSKVSEKDQAFDEKIKKDLHGLRIPFNSKHWIILKEQLELEALFKKKLFVAKSVELLVLAFLVLGILNLWPIQKDVYHIPVDDSPMIASIPVDKETAEIFVVKERVRMAAQKETFKSTKAIIRNAIYPNFLLSSEVNSKPNSTLKAIPNNKTNLKGNNLIKPLNKSVIEIPFINLFNIESTEQSQSNDVNTNTTDGPFAQIITKEIKELDIPDRPIGFPDIVLNNNYNRKEENTYLSFAVGPKVNLINSPFDPVYGFDPYNTINTNFNISAKINIEIGPIELYAGLGYTNTSYVPRLVDEVYEPLESQYNEASLKNIKFKTFNVPVGVKHNVLESNKFQLYAAAGVDLNIIADSEYKIQDIPLGNSQPAPPPRPENFVNENAKLSQKDFNKGILSGGSLKNNLFATASIGLGLNWNLSPQTGIFIEPRYSHFISSKGIGPNEDKVHGLSIDLGVRYQLN